MIKSPEYFGYQQATVLVYLLGGQPHPLLFCMKRVKLVWLKKVIKLRRSGEMHLKV